MLSFALFVVITITTISLNHGFSSSRSMNYLKTSSSYNSPKPSINQQYISNSIHSFTSKDTKLNAQFNDVINPSKFDLKRIIYTLGGQAILTAAAFILGSIYNIDVLHLDNLQTETTILQETVLPSLGIFLVIFTFSYLVKDVQLNGLQEFFRERKFYVLKTLGLQTDRVVAVIIAVIIALGKTL